MSRARTSHLFNPVHFIALGFGSGLSRYAPGTVGSVVALLLYILFLSVLSVRDYLLFLLCALALGVVVCEYSARILRKSDHPAIVWDEFVGMWVTMTAVPHSWHWFLIGLLLFRLLDILKPPPISRLERLPGGVGMMMDDVAAGAMAALIIMLLGLVGL